MNSSISLSSLSSSPSNFEPIKKGPPSPTSVTTPQQGGRIISLTKGSADHGIPTRKISAADFLHQATEAKNSKITSVKVSTVRSLKSKSTDTASTKSSSSSKSKK